VPRISDPNCGEVLSDLVGSTLKLKVIEVDKERNRLILSERAVTAEKREEEAEKLLESLEKGQVREGRVSNLTHFGAFVDLGGLDGLLHLSEISWYPVNHPGDVLEVGQELEVMVINVDRERKQFALSMKRLQSDPWVTVGERYKVGQLVEGRISRLTKWGAFVRLIGDEAIEGLIHISELDEGRIAHPRDVVRPGDVVTLCIVRVEPERHRLALSMKRVSEEERVGEDGKDDGSGLDHRAS
jgi:small subunit ribosomal protein S1